MRLMISDGRPKAQERFPNLLCCDMAKLSTFSSAILKGEIASAAHTALANAGRRILLKINDSSSSTKKSHSS